MPDLNRQMRPEPIMVTADEVAAALEAQRRLDDYMAGHGAGFDRGKAVGRAAGERDAKRGALPVAIALAFAALGAGVMAGRYLDNAAANALQAAAAIAGIGLPFWLGRRRS